MSGTKRPKDQLENNIERLLSQIDPQLEMPETDVKRVIGELAEENRSVTKPLRHRPRIFFGAAVAVAAVVVLALLLPRGNDGIVWADVARHLETVKSLSSPFFGDKVGDVWKQQGHLYLKDPGKMRLELFVDPNSQSLVQPRAQNLELVSIRNYEPEGATSSLLTIHVQNRSVFKANYSHMGIPQIRGPEQTMPATFVWDVFAKVHGSSAEKIGRRLIGDTWTAGFEAILSDVADDSFLDFSGDAIVRVWASEETAVPLAMEFEGGSCSDQKGRTIRLEPLLWNPSIDDTVFSLADFEDFEIDEQNALKVWFNRTRLAPDTSLLLPRAGGGPPLFSADDVISIAVGEAFWDPGERAESGGRWLHLDVSSESLERVRSALGSPPYEPIKVVLDGHRLNLVVHGPCSGGNNGMSLDIAPLGLTLEEFEDRYLVD